jgi:hypothetical protein
MFRLMHEMRVRIMIALVDPLAADADLAAAFWGWYPSVKITWRLRAALGTVW